jgi:hypothetical protein
MRGPRRSVEIASILRCGLRQNLDVTE